MSVATLNNLTAFNAKGAMDRIVARQARSTEKLSSGQRLNRAADDPSGTAIAELMRAQNRGTNQAENNVQDGVSLLQTAEGGLQVIGDMLQRIRGLAIQAANDTLTTSDRNHIQTEVNQLLSEIDRQASTVNFNTKRLVTGAYNGAAGATRTFDSQGVVTTDSGPNYYRVSVADPTATAPEPAVGTEFSDVQYGLADAVNGTAYEAATGIAGNNLAFRFQFQPNADASRISALSFRMVGGSSANGVTPDNIVMQLYDFQNGQWETVANNSTGQIPGVTDVSGSASGDLSRFVDSDGDIWAQGYVQTDVAPGGDNRLSIDYASLSVTERGEGLTIQAGANQDETIEINLPDASASGLGVSGLSVTTRTGAEDAISTVDDALTEIKDGRTRIGAYQNRLESAYSNNRTKRQNETAAESQIRDLDYANEIVNYTKDQILMQSATAAIAQANLMPQAVLQLLRF